MEVKFIWIKEFNNLVNAGFNFANSDNHEFSYDGSRLELKEKAYHSGLNYGDNISSITSICGENGAGKSSVLEMILINAAHTSDGTMSQIFNLEVIIVFGNYISFHESLELSNVHDLESMGFRVETHSKAPFDSIGRFNEHNPNTTFVGYSNYLYDGFYHDLPNHYSAMIDGLLSDDIRNARYFKENEEGGGYPTSVLAAFNQSDQNRIADLVVDDLIELPFDLKDRFLINIDFSRNNRFLSNDPLNIKSQNKEPIIELLDYLKDLEQSSWNELYGEAREDDWDRVLQSDDVKKEFIKLFRINVVRVFLRNCREDEVLYVLDPDSIRKFVFLGENYQDNLPTGYSSAYEKIDYINEKLLELVESAVWEDRIVPYEAYSARGLRYSEIIYKAIKFLDVDPNKHEEAFRAWRKVRDSIRELSGNMEFWYCSVSYYLSSGEKSFVNFFGRIKSAIDRALRERVSTETVVLLLDEPDVGFHPDWQRRFISYLVKFLDDNFEEIKFQVIITTHSPFVLSDIPTSNVIFLRKNPGNGHCQVFNSNMKTYAANIYELLADSFFLENGFIGEHAKASIESLINYLSSEGLESELWNQEKAEYFIDLLGDDLMKTRIEDLFRSKFQVESDTLQNERDKLLLRVAKIDQILANDSDTPN